MTFVQVVLSKANHFCRTRTLICRKRSPDWRTGWTDWRTGWTDWRTGWTDLIGRFDRITLAGS